MTTETNSEQESQTIGDQNRKKFRRFFSQFVSTSVKNMLVLGWGLSTVFPALIIPAVTGIPNEHNQNEYLTMTAVQVSWLGSVGYIIEPIGSITSALITDWLGRRRAMMVANIPFIVGWFLLYQANSVFIIFVGIILMGLGCGLIESPTLSFIGEICEPSYRGVLLAYTNITGTIGTLFIFFLNTLLPWRTVALICMFWPILTIIALCFIPETPLWLLSKNRVEEAEKSLCWLRGWTTKQAIEKEFNDLQRYSERSKFCNSCIKSNQKCSHPLPTLLDKFKEIRRRSTLRPFFIVISLFFISHFSGLFGLSPFIVQVFKAYDSPIAPDRAATVANVVSNLANLVFLCLLRFTGKRPLYLTMLCGTFLCSAVICGYGFAVLPTGYNSFDKSQYFSLENKTLSYIPFLCLIMLSFCTFCGPNSLPWQMMSELFPQKTRGLATGLTAALNYLLSFIATKSYYNLETTLSMPGVALFNCVIIAAGFTLMINILPETENRSLEDIELHFANKSNKFTNHKIPKMKSKKEIYDSEHGKNVEIPEKYTKFSEVLDQ